MKKLINLALALALALGAPLCIVGCGNWETVTSGGIAIDSVERDENGYIVEDAAVDAALTMAEIYDPAFCSFLDSRLDDSSSPARWIVDFEAEGSTFHYEVNAENGDLITFGSIGF